MHQIPGFLEHGFELLTFYWRE